MAAAFDHARTQSCGLSRCHHGIPRGQEPPGSGTSVAKAVGAARSAAATSTCPPTGTSARSRNAVPRLFEWLPRNGDAAAGSFVMGAPPGEEERENVPDYFRGHSVPQHLVTIRYHLAIAKFDVTRDEYAQFVAKTNRPDPDSCYGPDASGRENDIKGANWHSPGFPQTGRDPVVCVSWDDAQAYVAWLSAKTGHVYRLPTRLSGNMRRVRERRRRVTLALVLRSSAATSIMLIWTTVSRILTIAT